MTLLSDMTPPLPPQKHIAASPGPDELVTPAPCNGRNWKALPPGRDAVILEDIDIPP
jgi:hypothetical protein